MANRGIALSLCSSLVLFACIENALAAPGTFQWPKTVSPPPPSDLRQIPLVAGGPISSSGEIWAESNNQLSVRDVTLPTLTPFLPAPGKANGAAVIIAPGGAFMNLSFQTEGTMVAQWLAAHGVAGFVLKYRLNPTSSDPAIFHQQGAAMFDSRYGNAIDRLAKSPAAAWAEQDGLAAIRLVRLEATEFHIDPHRIGFIGFSAGAMTAMNVVTAYDANSRPDFVGSIYGAMPARPVPADAPPLFIAMAADDPLMGGEALPMFTAWRAAGKSAELHVFTAGGHGFGMMPQGTSSDHWIDEFYWWMQANHLLAK